MWTPGCSGNSTRAVLGFHFRTDVSMLRVPIKPPLEFSYGPDGALSTAAKALAEALSLSATTVLNIDPSELGAGFRFLPRLDSDDSSVLGHVDFFLYDTTPGGAGFASAAFEALPAIMKACRERMASCNCTSSCAKCLRTYDNRFDHLTLDRFLGQSLLSYMETGMIPPVTGRRLRSLYDPLAQSVQLILSGDSSDFRHSPSDSGGQFSIRSTTIEVKVAPALLGSQHLTPVPTVKATHQLEVSELLLLRERPAVAYHVDQCLH